MVPDGLTLGRTEQSLTTPFGSHWLAAARWRCVWERSCSTPDGDSLCLRQKHSLCLEHTLQMTPEPTEMQPGWHNSHSNGHWMHRRQNLITAVALFAPHWPRDCVCLWPSGRAAPAPGPPYYRVPKSECLQCNKFTKCYFWNVWDVCLHLLKTSTE